MERAGISGFVAMFETGQCCSAMCAGINERIEPTLLVASDEDRLSTNLCGVVIVDFGQLTVMGQVNPIAFEDMLHLQFK